MNRLITTAAIALFAGVATAGPASFTAHAANIEIEAEGPVVELSIYETIELEPDIATIGAGVSTEARSAVEAMRLNAVEMRRVIERIKSLGVDEKDIQTTGINLNARYDYDRTNQKQVFRGYQVSNRVRVKLREIEQTGEVLDALVVAGATDLNGPTFSTEDDTEAKELARTRAMERVRARAMAYANLAGYDDVKLLAISESITGRGAVQPMARSVVAMDALEAAAPVQPGMITSGVSISVKYEMVSADHSE
ncbi:MAG: SIMPL domain-containing protein [Erythrobacter sp.]